MSAVMGGIAVSGGIAIGKVLRYVPGTPEPEIRAVPPEEREAEKAQFFRARDLARTQLEGLARTSGGQGAQVLEAHLQLLEDPDLESGVLEAIEAEGVSCDQGIDQVLTGFIQMFSQMDDEIMRERAADMADIRVRLLRCRQGGGEAGLTGLTTPVIVAARDLMPSDTATLDRDKVLGIVTEVGGATCHTAILARSWGIPAVLGVKGLMDRVENGEELILDALDGEVICGPDSGQLAQYRERQRVYGAMTEARKKHLYDAPATTDGTLVEVCLNMEAPTVRDLEAAAYTDGVGLYRTEFLFMDRPDLPGEQEQVEAYSRVLRAYGEKPVVLRTMDIGGDKQVPGLAPPEEMNPFLGKRALRLCFDRPELFKTQLRACMRAGVHGNLWVMFPMVGSMDDIRRAKQFVRQAQAELEADGLPYSDAVKWGVMVEIPALVHIAEHVADEVDFASIGTNDLTQYTLAADRMNAEVAPYYQMYHPAVFHMIKRLAEVFRARGGHLAVCGELGGDPAAVPALLGCGIRCLSMGAEAVAGVKQVIGRTSTAEAEALADTVLALPTAGEIEMLLGEHYARLCK